MLRPNPTPTARRPAFWVAIIIFGGLFCWPVRTAVSVPIQLTILTEEGSPFVGVMVTQQWSVYGYGGSRGLDTRATDSAGVVKLPARYSAATLGMRILRRTRVFFKQCMTIPFYGHFTSGYTDKWGPIGNIEVQLPPGVWVPAQPYHGYTSPYADDNDFNYSNGPHHYIELRNKDSHHPMAYIQGIAEVTLNDSDIVLRLSPKPEEPKDRIELHNLLYKKGFDLVQPYLGLPGEPIKSPKDTKTRDELERGLALCERVLGLNPGNLSAAWLAGKASESLGNQERAYLFFKNAFLSNKPNPSPKANLALARLCAGDLSGAKAIIEEDLLRDPKDEINIRLQRFISELGKQKPPKSPADPER